jgi:hypothetical protein
MATIKTKKKPLPQTLDGGEITQEQQAFRRKRSQLLQRYEGQFVALYQGRLAGHGADDEELALRMFKKFGDAPFYIAKVEREPTVYELPSPEAVS